MSVTIAAIKDAVASEFGVSVLDIDSDRRSQSVAIPRFAVIHLAKELTRHSFPTIGRCIGDRDHSSAIHGFRKAADMLANDRRFKRAYTRAKKKLETSANFSEAIAGELSERDLRRIRLYEATAAARAITAGITSMARSDPDEFLRKVAALSKSIRRRRNQP
ncbi:MAG: hypothetical protein HQL45_14160 [Alphaproteobacteria bacterium]|nr:hypothetical protein [Alphaproteobacteria bacterium]